MKNAQILIVIAVIMGALALAGCSKDNGTTNPGTTTDQQAIQAQIVHSDSISQFLASDETAIDDGTSPQDPEYGGTAKINTLVPVVRYGRHIFWNLATRNYAVVKLGDTAAVVTVTTTIPGEFILAVGTRTSGSVQIDSLIRKPFTETIGRNIRFKRIAHNDDPNMNWRPVAISLTIGSSDSSRNFHIAGAEFVIAGQDTVLHDPIHAWYWLGHPFRSGIPFVHIHDSVRVRVWVQSTNDSAEVVHLRHGVEGGAALGMRLKMNFMKDSVVANVHNRIYARSFDAHSFVSANLFDIVRRYSAVVDVFSYNSIFDDTAAFSNEFWGFPYMVYK